MKRCRQSRLYIWKDDATGTVEGGGGGQGRSTNIRGGGRGRGVVPKSVTTRTSVKQVKKMKKKCPKNPRPNFPADLWPDIIKSLPLEALCRFKCVSKSWRSLIINHFNQIPRSPIVLWGLHNSRLSLYSISIDDHNTSTAVATHFCTSSYLLHTSSHDSPRMTLLREANGLFCFTDMGLKTQGICNPITQEKLYLPMTTGDRLVFAFGYHPSSREYKILAWNANNFADFRIFTLGTQSWRTVASKPASRCGQPITHSVRCIQGTIYWFTIVNTIISFNLSTEKFGAIEGPKRVSEIRTCPLYIFELEGCLCLADVHYDSGNLDLWMLKRTGNRGKECWVMIASVVPPWSSHNHSIPCFTRTGEMVLALDNDSKMLYLYNFVTCQYDAIRITGLPSHELLPTNYTENSVSLRDLFAR